MLEKYCCTLALKKIYNKKNWSKLAKFTIFSDLSLGQIFEELLGFKNIPLKISIKKLLTQIMKQLEFFRNDEKIQP